MTFAAIKDPDAVFEYSIDWGPVLEASNPVDTIFGSSWVTSGAMVIDSNSFSDTKSTVWVSGGTLNSLEKLVNTVITASSPARHYVKTINVSVKDT